MHAQRRRSSVLFILLAGVCAIILRTRSAPSVFFAPVGDSSVIERPAKDDTLDARRAHFEKLKKGPKFLKVVLGPDEYVPLLTDLSQLEERTQARLELAPKGQYWPYSTESLKPLLLSGEDKNVLSALREILPKGSVTATAVTAIFLVPRGTAGLLIGEGGENIQRVQNSTSAKVTLRGAGFEEAVTVRGPPQSVMGVAEYILDKQLQFSQAMVNYMTTNYIGRRGTSAVCEILLTLSPDQIRQVIGKNGETISRITNMFGVKLETDREHRTADGKSILKIAGSAGSVHSTHLYLLEHFILPQRDTQSAVAL